MHRRGFVGMFDPVPCQHPQLYRRHWPEQGSGATRTSVKEVSQTLRAYVGSVYVNNFNAFGRFWQVNVMADEQFR